MFFVKMLRQYPTRLQHLKLPYKHFFRDRRCFSITSSHFSSFDGLVLGVYKDGALTETTKNDIPNTIKEAINNNLKLSGTKGKFGEVRTMYGLEGLANQVALVTLQKKTDKEELTKALENARMAVSIFCLRSQF
jgi:hypothetical protein